MNKRLLFDKADYDLLDLIENLAGQGKSPNYLKRLFDPCLHPRGIKEMAAPREMRIAYALFKLIDSLKMGKAKNERINALRSLRDEILRGSPSALRRNTARILLQIMKELVRGRGNQCGQLELAHDFRAALSGKPRFIRKQLKKYFLLEMPEEWNQVAFDDHVHDANTKGRKSPTHLIMDAWIKGIRSLQVVYYNYVPRDAAEELLEAANIMNVNVRIGVEFPALFHDKFAQLIWAPRGFRDASDFLEFLDTKPMVKLMEQGLQISQYQERQTLKALKVFNDVVLKKLGGDFKVKISPLEKSEFLAFVGKGQGSLIHLSEFALAKLNGAVTERSSDAKSASGNEKEVGEELRASASELSEWDAERILDVYLKPVVPPFTPQNTGDGPELLKISPRQLVERLRTVGSGFRLTLNLSGLSREDVLEVLFDCEGDISHLEIFNLKDYAFGQINTDINQLRIAINEGNVIKLKRLVSGMISANEKTKGATKKTRRRNLNDILRQLPALVSFYKDSPLAGRIGSDSTGRSRRLHGMGLAVVDTLPGRARKEIARSTPRLRETLPVKTTVRYRISLYPVSCKVKWINALMRAVRAIPLLRSMGFDRRGEWVVEDNAADMSGHGNIATLGGIQGFDEDSNELKSETSSEKRFSFNQLNTIVKNTLKVLLGLIPAFFTFYLSKDWWVLAWFGAFIWFGITGFRNILQSVLGGGGLRRSELLSWNDLISWERVADSLFYTGLSVPLLDYIVKTLIMREICGVTASSNPFLLYTVMALANGIYISSHNMIRGLPKTAIVGNGFRSILSIPLAIIFNAMIGGALSVLGVPGAAGILQQWAAVISKTASDCVAGVIEGTADHVNNVKLRLEDYKSKINQTFSVYAHLEMMFPEKDVMKLLESPKNLIQSLSNEGKELERMLIINALDLLYFWKYQPLAYNALSSVLAEMSQEERRIFNGCQKVLERDREISQMFLDGIVGKNFSKALAFFLSQSKPYLAVMDSMCSGVPFRD